MYCEHKININQIGMPRMDNYCKQCVLQEFTTKSVCYQCRDIVDKIRRCEIAMYVAMITIVSALAITLLTKSYFPETFSYYKSMFFILWGTGLFVSVYSYVRALLVIGVLDF